MIAHSFIRPMPTASQLAPALEMDLARESDEKRANWLRSLGRGRWQKPAAQQSTKRDPADVSQAAVEAPRVVGLPDTIAAPVVIIPAAAVRESAPEPEPEPELEPEVKPEPFAPRVDDGLEEREAAGEPESEPVTPRAGWCILEEPATPDRVGRVRRSIGDIDDRKPEALLLSSVPRSSTAEADGRQYTSYSVELCYPGTTQTCWSVERRYSEFAELHESLAESLARRSDVVLPAVPPSRWMGLMDPSFVSERREGLGAWLATMLSTPQLALQPQLHAFLETPDPILVQLGLREPPTPTRLPRKHSPGVRGDEVIQHQQHYTHMVASTAFTQAASPSLTLETAARARA